MDSVNNAIRDMQDVCRCLEEERIDLNSVYRVRDGVLRLISRLRAQRGYARNAHAQRGHDGANEDANTILEQEHRLRDELARLMAAEYIHRARSSVGHVDIDSHTAEVRETWEDEDRARERLGRLIAIHRLHAADEEDDAGPSQVLGRVLDVASRLPPARLRQGRAEHELLLHRADAANVAWQGMLETSESALETRQGPGRGQLPHAHLPPADALAATPRSPDPTPAHDVWNARQRAWQMEARQDSPATDPARSAIIIRSPRSGRILDVGVPEYDDSARGLVVLNSGTPEDSVAERALATPPQPFDGNVFTEEFFNNHWTELHQPTPRWYLETEVEEGRGLPLLWSPENLTLLNLEEGDIERFIDVTRFLVHSPHPEFRTQTFALLDRSRQVFFQLGDYPSDLQCQQYLTLLRELHALLESYESVLPNPQAPLARILFERVRSMLDYMWNAFTQREYPNSHLRLGHLDYPMEWERRGNGDDFALVSDSEDSDDVAMEHELIQPVFDDSELENDINRRRSYSVVELRALRPPEGQEPVVPHPADVPQTPPAQTTLPTDVRRDGEFHSPRAESNSSYADFTNGQREGHRAPVR